MDTNTMNETMKLTATVNGLSEKKEKKEPKPTTNGLTKAFNDALEIVRAWEMASPQARELFLKAIGK